MRWQLVSGQMLCLQYHSTVYRSCVPWGRSQLTETPIMGGQSQPRTVHGAIPFHLADTLNSPYGQVEHIHVFIYMTTHIQATMYIHVDINIYTYTSRYNKTHSAIHARTHTVSTISIPTHVYVHEHTSLHLEMQPLSHPQTFYVHIHTCIHI